MNLHGLLFLALAGLLGGGMNALAGGGSFATLPAMIAAGLPPVIANASSTVALWPGGLAGAWTYRAGLRPICGVAVAPALAVSFAGGLVGAVLLLVLPAHSFDVVLPWLLLLATVTLAFGRRAGEALQGRLRAAPLGTGRSSMGRRLMLAVQFLLAIYGGYFGGAVGLMMAAAWSFFGEADLRALNAPRTLMVAAANSMAILVFAAVGVVRWAPTLAMLAGGIAGGVVGARIGRRLPARITRAMTLTFATAITAVFFARRF